MSYLFEKPNSSINTLEDLTRGNMTKFLDRRVTNIDANIVRFSTVCLSLMIFSIPLSFDIIWVV